MTRAIGAVAFAAVLLLAATATPALANPGGIIPTDPGVADHNGDCRVDLSDAVVIVQHAFQSEPLVTFSCGDCNDDGDPNVSDPIFVLTHLFLGGGGPPAGHTPDMQIEVTCSDLGP